MKQLPEEYWPNVHMTDIRFAGELTEKEEIKTNAEQLKNQKLIGYNLTFEIDTLFAAYPEEAQQGNSTGLVFLFKGNEDAVPAIKAMTAGQRYFIHGWEDIGALGPDLWESTHGDTFQIVPLNDQLLWYMPLAKGESIDFSAPGMASIKNAIDILNENLHTQGIIATADMSAMPRMQESSHYYFLAEGRWLNHEDDLARNKVIAVPKHFADLRGFQLGDTISLTFRPLKDTYYGYIRDGIDAASWRSYPTYQDTFKIVGIFSLKTNTPIYAYIPASSIPPGYASTTQIQNRDEADYSFVLKSSRDENEITQAYKDRLKELGLSLTFLPNNGPAYWAAVDPIRHSSSADMLVLGALMLVALILAVFLYLMARKQDYAILKALGVPAKRANRQMTFPLLLLGGLGILAGGLSSWKFALNQAKDALTTLPMPSGVTLTADLSPFILAGSCAAVFLLLALFTWLGVLSWPTHPSMS